MMLRFHDQTRFKIVSATTKEALHRRATAAVLSGRTRVEVNQA
jgi:hypothetical protein